MQQKAHNTQQRFFLPDAEARRLFVENSRA